MDDKMLQRKELLEELYYAKSIINQVRDLVIQREDKQRLYQNMIPHENIIRQIEYKSKVMPREEKEKKQIKGIWGLLLILGLWIFLFFIQILRIMFQKNHGIFDAITWNLAEHLADIPMFLDSFLHFMENLGFDYGNLNLDGYEYLMKDLQFFVGIALGLPIAIFIKIMINQYIKSGNISIRKKNEKIRQEKRKIEQDNQRIINHNQNLDQINREIDLKNEQIMEYNHNVDKQISDIEYRIAELHKEAQLFLQDDKFPRKYFDLSIIDYFIEQVESHRCYTIQECVNAYDADLKYQETQKYQQSVIQHQESMIKNQEEQISMQKISNAIEFAQLILQGETIAALDKVRNSVDNAAYQTMKNRDAINNVAHEVKKK